MYAVPTRWYRPGREQHVDSPAMFSLPDRTPDRAICDWLRSGITAQPKTAPPSPSSPTRRRGPRRGPFLFPE